MWTSADVDFTYVDLADVAFDDMDPCDMEPPNFATSYALIHSLIN